MHTLRLGLGAGSPFWPLCHQPLSLAKKLGVSGWLKPFIHTRSKTGSDENHHEIDHLVQALTLSYMVKDEKMPNKRRLISVHFYYYFLYYLMILLEYPFLVESSGCCSRPSPVRRQSLIDTGVVSVHNLRQVNLDNTQLRNAISQNKESIVEQRASIITPLSAPIIEMRVGEAKHDIIRVYKLG